MHCFNYLFAIANIYNNKCYKKEMISEKNYSSTQFTEIRKKV